MESTINLNTAKISKNESSLLSGLKIFTPFLAGIIGFVIALTTLITIYFLVTESFSIGYVTMGTIEFLIAFCIGFIPLYLYAHHALKKKSEELE
jgi:hypothetical protein